MRPRGASGFERMLRRFGYAHRTRAERGLLLRFLIKVTGYSAAQMKRLLKQFRTERHLRDRRGPPAKPFAYRYTVADQQALAALDALHGNLSGPATRKLAGTTPIGPLSPEFVVRS